MLSSLTLPPVNLWLLSLAFTVFLISFFSRQVNAFVLFLLGGECLTTYFESVVCLWPQFSDEFKRSCFSFSRFFLVIMWKQPPLSCMLYLQAKVKIFKAPFSCSIKCAHHNIWNMARAHEYKFSLCLLNLEGFCPFKAVVSRSENILGFPTIIDWHIAFSKMLIDNFWQQGVGRDVIFHY